MDPEEELERADEKRKEIVKNIENKTIYVVDLNPSVKRAYVNYVSEDSRYKKSFDEYLEQIANKIRGNLKRRGFGLEDIATYLVMDEYVMLQDINDDLPNGSKILAYISLIGSDYDTICEIIKRNF